MSYANNRPRVYLFNLQTGRQSVLGDFTGMTFAPRFAPTAAAWSWRWRTAAGRTSSPSIWAVESSRRLTSSGSIDVSPCYSPDGSQIAFASDRGGDQQIYVMDAGGGGAEAHQLRQRPLRARRCGHRAAT